MENRYDGILQQHVRAITELYPADTLLRLVMAYEFAAIYKPGMRVLEIGCGDGGSAEPLLKRTDARLVLLDESSEMIQDCRQRLAAYADRTDYVCEDALAHLNRGERYDIIVSSWTIHNFSWPDKDKLFWAICESLPSGGAFILMDKIIPHARGDDLLHVQCRRFRYLPPDVERAIVAHEHADFNEEYRMDEARLCKSLRLAGFKKLTLVDRVERDGVLVARK